MQKKLPLLYRLEQKYGKYAISNLMLYIIGVMVIVYVVDFALGNTYGFTLSAWMYFDRDLLLAGEWWRAITFLFLPPDSNPIFIIFALYFEYLIGKGLEQQWGTLKFNLFYLCGFLLSLAGGFIAGTATNVFLNASLFFAFALFYPNFEVLLFFFLPLKIKYLALVDAALYILWLIIYPWPMRIQIVISLANLLLFFWPAIRWNVQRFKQNRALKKMRQESRDRYK